MLAPDHKTICAKLDELSLLSTPTDRRVVHDLRGLIQALFIQIEVDQIRVKKQQAVNSELFEACKGVRNLAWTGFLQEFIGERWLTRVLDAVKHAEETL